MISFNNSEFPNDLENYICSNFATDIYNHEETPVFDGIWFFPGLKQVEDGLNIKNYIFRNKIEINSVK